MTYALKIKSSTHSAGEQELSGLDPLAVAKLAPLEENTHSFILKYFKKEWEILEAGCGLGRWMIHLDDLGYSMTGIDLSNQAIEKKNRDNITQGAYAFKIEKWKRYNQVGRQKKFS